MHERTETKAIMVAMKSDGTHFIVDNLETPIGQLPHAVIRCRDTLAIRAKWKHFNDTQSQV